MRCEGEERARMVRMNGISGPRLAWTVRSIMKFSLLSVHFLFWHRCVHSAGLCFLIYCMWRTT